MSSLRHRIPLSWLCLLFIHPPAHGSEVSPAARNTLDSARIPRTSKLLICGLFQKGRVLAQDGARLQDMRIQDGQHSYASRALALGESLPMIGAAARSHTGRDQGALRTSREGFGAGFGGTDFGEHRRRPPQPLWQHVKKPPQRFASHLYRFVLECQRWSSQGQEINARRKVCWFEFKRRLHEKNQREVGAPRGVSVLEAGLRNTNERRSTR